MITKKQTINLSKAFQIDEFSIFREYLQLVFLSYLYQERQAHKFFFKGGTALRLLFDSPRFSEDLDFSTSFSDKEISKLLAVLEEKMSKELGNLKIVPIYSGKDGIRFRIRYNAVDFKYPLSVRLDFHRTTDIKNTQISTLATKFPITIFPQVFHFSKIGILTEKLQTLETRCKGRDIFDVWYLLSKGVSLTKMKYDKDLINKRIKSFSIKTLNTDLGKFLPKNQKTIIPTLQKEVIRLLGQ